MKPYLLGSIILNLILILLLLGQQWSFDQVMANWTAPDNRELIMCQEMNKNASRLLSKESIIIKIKE